VAALKGAGISPTREQARLLLAQLRFEGLGSCNNHNCGNITTSDTASRDFFRPTWFAVDPNDPKADPQLVRLHTAMLAGKAPRAFRSYPDFAAGFADYTHELTSRFPSILAAAATGDAQATATAIKTSGYTPDAPSSLGTTLASIVREFDGRGLLGELPPLAGPTPPPLPPSPPSPTGPSSPSSPSPPTSTPVPGVAEELATVMIWKGEDGARGFTLTIGTSMHSGPLRDLPTWLSELGLAESAA
jgi:hypothetical protein